MSTTTTRTFGWRLCAAAMVAACSVGLRAAEPAADPAEDSPAHLVHLLRYVVWPEEVFPSPEAALVIGVFRTTPPEGGVPSIAGRQAQGRPIVVVAAADQELPQPCHLLYVPASADAAAAREVVQQLGARPILVVTEFSAEELPQAAVRIDAAAGNGGPSLAIDLEEVERRGLRVDARLLKLANIARRGPP